MHIGSFRPAPATPRSIAPLGPRGPLAASQASLHSQTSQQAPPPCQPAGQPASLSAPSRCACLHAALGQAVPPLALPKVPRQGPAQTAGHAGGMMRQDRAATSGGGSSSGGRSGAGSSSGNSDVAFSSRREWRTRGASAPVERIIHARRVHALKRETVHHQALHGGNASAGAGRQGE